MSDDIKYNEYDKFDSDKEMSKLPRYTCKYRSICNEDCGATECPAEYFEQGTGPEIEKGY